MSVFNDNAAYTHAVSIVTAGLQSGAIKLSGVAPSTRSSMAAVDAEYLNTLINAVAKNLTAQ